MWLHQKTSRLIAFFIIVVVPTFTTVLCVFTQESFETQMAQSMFQAYGK